MAGWLCGGADGVATPLCSGQDVAGSSKVSGSKREAALLVPRPRPYIIRSNTVLEPIAAIHTAIYMLTRAD